jgi:phage tail-like protein
VAEFLSLFNFEVQLVASGRGGDDRVSRVAAFSEVGGLETNIEMRELREGGYNLGVRRLVAKTSHPNLVFKRGVTVDPAFWEWVQRCTQGVFPLPYVDGAIVQLSPAADRDPSKQVRFRFKNGIVTKVKSADLSGAGSTTIPIEELHVAHEGLERVIP